MATDLLSRQVTFNYAEGAATMTRGLADRIFGLEWRIGSGNPTNKSVTVKSHSRKRIIGQPAKNVAGYSFTLKRYPTMDAQQAAGGQAVLIQLSDGDEWTVRVSGPMSAFCAWFAGKITATNVTVRSQKGTKYGPFGFLAA
jgi:hypothetical protein